MKDDRIDALLTEARRSPPQPPADLMARVLAEGLAMQPAMSGADGPVARRTTTPKAVTRPGLGLWARWSGGFLAGLGGSGVFASLGVVAAVSLVFGYADPTGLAGELMSQADGGYEIVPVAGPFLDGVDE